MFIAQIKSTKALINKKNMKKIIILGMLLLSVSISKAQTKAVKANPLGLFLELQMQDLNFQLVIHNR